jgi:hypothetical protein
MKTRLIIQGCGSAAISATAGSLAVLHGPSYVVLGGMVLLAWVALNLAIGGNTYPHERVVLIILACVMLAGAVGIVLGVKP